jgi:putative membrane protein
MLGALLSAGVPGSPGSPGVTGEEDGHFLRMAVLSSRQALTDADAALQLTDKPEIRNAARTIWKDHVRASAKLSNLAKAKGMSWLDETPIGAPRTAESSDAARIAGLLEANEEAVALFHQEAVRGSDTELRQFAQQTLPTLQRRLQTLRHLQDAYPV